MEVESLSEEEIFTEIRARITSVEDDSFPVWLRFDVTDFHGVRHEFVEKAPVLLDEPIPETFPNWIYLRAQLVARSADFVTVRTDKPLGITAIEGQTVFDIAVDELPTIE